MTESGEQGSPAHFQSADSAQDGVISDSLAIDSTVNADDEVAAGLPVAPSPPPPVPRAVARHAKNRPVAPEPPPVGPYDQDATAVLPRMPADAGPPSGTSPDSGTGPDAADVPPGGAGRSPRRRGRKAKRRKAPWWELPLLVAIAILVAVLVKTFVIQPFYIPSESMENTLYGCHNCAGDRILVNKPIYDLRDPHPGDIVVFHAPPGWDDETPLRPPSNPVARFVRGFGQLVGFVPPDGLVLVKRVIAGQGQTVKGDAAGHVLISTHGPNGPFRTLDEPYVHEDGVDSHAAFGPVTVPKGRLWVMGDHRNDSADSRFHCAGDSQSTSSACDPTQSTVPIGDVIGKAVVIAWPPSRWRTLGTPSTFTSAARALGGELPLVGSALVVLPLYLLRRRRRNRR